MLAVQKTVRGPGVSLVEVPEPASPAPDEVIIEVAAAGICGSDVHIYEWKGSSYTSLERAMPVTLGHEFAGRVVAVGTEVTSLRPGDRITAVPSIGCGSCDACEAGRSNRCAAQQGVGLSRAGCFARYLRLPSRVCLPLPDSVSDELGALVEPLTIAMNAILVGQVGEGQRVLIIGAGPIAQGMAVFARAAGAKEVVVAGMNDSARFAVFRRLRFDRLIDFAHPSAAEQLALAKADGFDVVLEAAGAPPTIQQGVENLRHSGVLVVSGIHPGAATFDVTQVVRRSLQIRGAYGAPLQVWRDVISALGRDPDAFLPIITHRLPFDRALQGFDLACKREASKVLLLF